MILVDSLYINNGGGKILLDYLVEQIERAKKDVFYLFDDRCKGEYLEVPSSRKVYLKASLTKRHKFYKKHIGKFATVFCFGNLAPTLRLQCQVYTYFHQTLYLNIPKEFRMKDKLLFKLKTFIFRNLLSNTDYILVQSDFMKHGIKEKFQISENSIKILPFYDDNGLKKTFNKESNTFIYVSGGSEHKNHRRLINAFSNYYNKTKCGKLYLTVPHSHNCLLNLIQEKVSAGIPIVNIGFIPRQELLDYYEFAEYLIFPSLEESFGLGIIEAIECGCKVVGADLPYMYQVCEPSITFNPFDENDIARAVQDAINKKEKATTPLVSNRIDQLLELLV